MAPAIFDMTKVTLESQTHLYGVEGSVLRFDGHLKVYNDQKSKRQSITCT